LKQKEFITAVSKQTQLDKDRVGTLLEATCRILSEQLIHGNSILIHGFGTFEVKKRAERISVHPATGKRWLVPPKIVPVFKPGPTLKEKIKQLNIHE
jgi:DNA-binding protein HU-beta